MTDLYRATLPHYCCGFEVERSSGDILDAAPIMRWAVGKKLEAFKKWAESKGGKIELVSYQSP